MKLSILISCTICFMLSNTVHAQFNTGSPELDTELKRINGEAGIDFGAFRADLALSYNASDKKIDYLHTSVKMQPAEIYLAFELSGLSGKPVDHVVEIYKVNRDKGWGYIAKELGIKPGSPEFHRLKDNAKNKSGKGKNKGNGKGNGKSGRK